VISLSRFVLCVTKRFNKYFNNYLEQQFKHFVLYEHSLAVNAQGAKDGMASLPKVATLHIQFSGHFTLQSGH